MSKQVGRKYKQQETTISASDWQATKTPPIVRKAIISFFMLLTLLFFAGPAIAGTADGLFAKAQNPLASPATKSYRVAQLSTSLDNWQSEAFAAIAMQKRLDRLARQQKQQTAVKKRKTRARPKVKKAVVRSKSKSKSKSKRRAKIKAKRKAKSQIVDARSYRDVKIVREPAKLQYCLQAAGYFNGAITGRFDKPTRKAYLAFRNAKKLRHRPNNFYDPVIQKALFGQCPKVNDAVSNPVIANATIAKPVSTNKSAKVDMLGETSFANDVLAATNSETTSSSTGVRTRKLARLDMGGPTGASSSFAVKRPLISKPVISRPVIAKIDRLVPRLSTRIASSAGMSSSPFSKRLSISDLAMAKPANPNTCSPQKHAPTIAMSVMPTISSTPTQAYPVRTASAYDTYMNDDGPLITGSISNSSARSSVSSSHRNPILKAYKRRTRLVQMEVPDKACLPQDLYNMLATAHGRKTDVSICKRDCLPAPSSFSQGQKELFTEQYDINWCGRGCLGIADPLPLAELLKIEREARVHVCMKPQLRLTSAAKKGLDTKGLNATIRNLYTGLAGGYGNGDNIAVLIGNKNYGGHIGAYDAGHINIDAMKALLIDQLGYSPDNVLILRDARRADMVRLFGRRGDVSGELQRRMKSNPDAQLMVYFSGHASSTGLGLNNHLLPVDAVIGREDESAYSLSVLYDNLRELDARTTQLFLEASFNADRSTVIEAPNIAERRVNVAPIVPVRGLAVFTASTGDQKPLLDPETGIGLFTRYLISGLAGAADQRPIGNGDRIIDSVELYVHLAGNVRLAARKTLGLRQNPTFSRSDNLFLSQLSRKPRK